MFDEGGQFKRRVKVYEEMKVADRADLKPKAVPDTQCRANEIGIELGVWCKNCESWDCECCEN